MFADFSDFKTVFCKGDFIASFYSKLDEDDGRRQWHPTPVFLPGESQGQGSLVGCSPWGCTESDTPDVT